MRVKIFYFDDSTKGEELINTWLAKNEHIKVQHLIQSSKDYGTTLTIFYLQEPLNEN